MALVDLGIDPRVAAALEAQGIKDLHPPQKEAWAALKGGGNIVAAIPTASGKSLIAYLAILHRWLATGKKSLYVVPLRALASEKFDDLLQFKSLGITVGIATGDLDEKDPKLGRFDVIVCTSEKADALLRHRTSWMDDIGCLVADELHLIHDPGRGPTLEVILSRFRQLIPNAQLIGLSATVANAKDVADWLGAKLIKSDWRPVELRVGTYFGDRLEFLGKPPRNLPSGGDPVASLAEDTIREGGQCLVFVSTRKAAESQATKLAGPIRAMLRPEDLAILEKESAALDDGGEGSPTAKKLGALVKAGVAYHTAGLDSAQRRFVEANFRAGRIKVLCATPTLAAGVNTPARRVVVRDLTRFEMGEGSRPLPVMEVKQMMGRAGRPRYDPYGEAVLLVKSSDQKEQVEEEYLRGTPEALTSKLAADAALRMHTLASVAGGYANTTTELSKFFKSTFWAQETSEWIVSDRLDDTVGFLEGHGFLDESAGKLKATLFGRRTSDLYIDPFSALRMRTAMESTTQVGAVAANLKDRASATAKQKDGTPARATPKDDAFAARAAALGAPTTFGLLEVVCGCPDLLPLYLRQGDDWVQQRFWDHHEEILVPEDGKDLESAMSYAKTAFLLMDWMTETRLDDIETRYQIGPGDLRLRLDNGNWLLHAFRELARALRPDWVQPLNDLVLRLEHGVKEELLPLIRLRGVGRIRARTLHAAGFHTPAALKGTPISTLTKLPGIGDALARDLLRQVGDDPSSEAPIPLAAPPQRGKGQSSFVDFGGST